jgi:predicted DNA-binding transcriptional regulator
LWTREVLAETTGAKMAQKIREITTEVMFSDDQTTACISGFYKGELVVQEIVTLETATHSYSAAKFIPSIRNKVRKAVGI